MMDAKKYVKSIMEALSGITPRALLVRTAHLTCRTTPGTKMAVTTKQTAHRYPLLGRLKPKSRLGLLKMALQRGMVRRTSSNIAASRTFR
jgi:hypothetical protein